MTSLHVIFPPKNLKRVFVCDLYHFVSNLNKPVFLEIWQRFVDKRVSRCKRFHHSDGGICSPLPLAG